MRNLFIIAESQVCCDLPLSRCGAPVPESQRTKQNVEDEGFQVHDWSCEREDQLAWLTVNPENGDVYAATVRGIAFGFRPSHPGEILFEFSLLSPKEEEEEGGVDGPTAVEGSFVDRIMAFEYLVEEEALLVAMEAGELLLLRLEQQEVECVGYIQGGISSLSSSPDGEVFVIATRNEKLLMLTKEWEVLAEVDMESNEISSVCSVRISWRGDGKYFATLNSEGMADDDANQGTGTCVQVWEREGCVLHSCSEKMNSLLSPVAWQPNGSLIAVARKAGRSSQEGTGGGRIKKGDLAEDGKDRGVEVTLFERNGLRRGGFRLGRALRDGYHCASIDELAWNMDSELLLITVRGKQQQQSHDAVQIWFRNNYHWYMKLEWQFESGMRVHAFWDAERPLRLHLWMSFGIYRCVDLGWDSAVERCSQANPTAAVIDGRFLRITPLADSLVPPPMSTAVIVHSACIRCTSVLYLPAAGLSERGNSFPRNNHSSVVAAVLSDGSLAIREFCPTGWIVEEEEITSENGEATEDEWGGTMLHAERVELGSGHRLHARQLAWLGPRSLLTVVPSCDVAIQRKELARSCCDDSLQSSQQHNGNNIQPRHSEERYSDGDLLVEVLLSSPNDEADAQERAEDGSAKKRIWTGTIVRELRTRLPVVRLVRDDVFSWVKRIAPSSVSGRGTIFVELEDGAVVKYVEGIGLVKSAEGNSLNSDVQSFPEKCPWIAVAAAASVGKRDDRQLWLVGLSGKGMLYLGKRVLAEDCVTFALHFGYLSSKGNSEIDTGEEEEQEAEAVAVVNLVFTTRRDVMHVLRVEDCVKGFRELESARPNTGGAAGERDITAFRVGDDISRFSAKDGSSPAAEKLGSQMTQVKDKERGGGGGDFSTQTVWERGARIVAVLGGRYVAVVLQTTRGNLETLFPRGLVLEEVGRAIRMSNYGRAMEMARRHRLDLNVLVDYGGWRSFLKRGVERFLKAVGNLGHVSELVLALNSGDVMEGVYKGYITSWDGKLNAGVVDDNDDDDDESQGPRDAADMMNSNGCVVLTAEHRSNIDGIDFNTGKVHAICKVIRQALLRDHKNSWPNCGRDLERCILTTLARSDPPELDEALRRIKLIKEREFGKTMGGEEEGGADSTGERSRGLSSEDALKHLMVLTDSNRLFDIALGMYDLHLAAMVSSHSQRDPKEFLPFLQELEAMTLPIRRYTIDKKLNRMESALRNLAKAGPPYHEECLALVRAHVELFPIAMEVFSRNEGQRNAVLEAWADHMLAEGSHSNAALAYSSCRQWSKAMTAYRAGGHWRGTLSLAGKLGFDSEKVKLLALELRDELKAMGQPVDAARVSIDYLDDLEGATDLLIQGREWLDALRVGYLCRSRGGGTCHEVGGMGREVDIVDMRVMSAAVETARVQMSDLEEEAERVEKYLRRWREVHMRRLQLAARLASERESWEATEGGEEDAESLADSVGSDLSAYGSRTVSSSSGLSSPRAGSSAASYSSGKLGKRASRRAAKRAAKGGSSKIRAGSPGEELALLEYVKGLAITTRIQEEIGQLTEVLVLLGKEGLASQLQHSVGKFMEVLQKAVSEMSASELQESTIHQVKDSVNQPKSTECNESGGYRSTKGRNGNDKIEGKPAQTLGVGVGVGGVQWRWTILGVQGGVFSPSSSSQ